MEKSSRHSTLKPTTRRRRLRLRQISCESRCKVQTAKYVRRLRVVMAVIIRERKKVQIDGKARIHFLIELSPNEIIRSAQLCRLPHNGTGKCVFSRSIAKTNNWLIRERRLPPSLPPSLPENGFVSPPSFSFCVCICLIGTVAQLWHYYSRTTNP